MEANSKVCTKCGVFKSLAQFSTNGDRLNAHCKECRTKTYKQKYHKTDREQERLRLKRLAGRAAAKDHVNAKKSAACTDCGQSYPPYVMQFDHLYDKEYNVGRLVGIGASIDKIDREIAKCELVCSNCHAIRTHQRRPLDKANEVVVQ